MSCEDADNLLKHGEVDGGTYLIHTKSCLDHCLALRSRHSVSHIKIVHKDGVYSTGHHQNYKTMSDLVGHYCTSPKRHSISTASPHPYSNDLGPLLPHVLSHVELKDVLYEGGFYVTKEAVQNGKKCVARMLNASSCGVSSSEQQHEMVIELQSLCLLLKTVQHNNVVEFLGVHIEEGTTLPYFLMKSTDYTLSMYLKKHGVPSPSIAHNILYDVAAGLYYLHNHSPPIVHGSLSANTVCLASLRAKIANLDLVLSTAYKKSASPKPQERCYMPPEVLHTEKEPHSSTAVDIFSFGVLIVHVLSGECPIPNLSEETRRERSIKKIDSNHPLLPLVKECLKDSRPNMSKVLTQIKVIIVIN